VLLLPPLLLPADVQDDPRDVQAVGPADGLADGLGRDSPIRADDRGGAARLHRYPFRPTSTRS
jgi:hypothetical protein